MSDRSETENQTTAEAFRSVIRDVQDLLRYPRCSSPEPRSPRTSIVRKGQAA